MAARRQGAGVWVVTIGEPNSVVHQPAKSARAEEIAPANQEVAAKLVEDDQDHQLGFGGRCRLATNGTATEENKERREANSDAHGTTAQ